jgi:hypothetical protein
MPIAYFQDDGWIHFKLTETKDRREGGFFTDSNGNSYSVADSEDYFTTGWPFVGLETASYPFNNVDGKLKVHLGDRYNSDTRLSGKQIASSGNCGDFNDGGMITKTEKRTEQNKNFCSVYIYKMSYREQVCFLSAR